MALASFAIGSDATLHGQIQRPNRTSGATVLRDLQEKWDKRSNSIVTIRLTARHFRNGYAGVRQLNGGEVAKLVAHIEAAPSKVGSIEYLAKSVRTESLSELPLWSKISFVTDGERSSESSVYQYVKDGRADVVADRLPRRQQVRVYSVGGSKYGTLSMEDFSIECSPSFADGLHVEGETDDGIAHFTGAIGKATIHAAVDVDSGLCRRAAITYKGLPARDVFQLGSILAAEGVVFPELIVKADYDGQGLLKLVDVIQVMDVEINEPLEADVFNVAVPAGATIVDLRQSRATTYEVPVKVPDAVEYLRGRTGDVPAPMGADEAGRHTWLRLLLAINFAAVGAIAWVIWRRRVMNAKRN